MTMTPSYTHTTKTSHLYLSLTYGVTSSEAETAVPKAALAKSVA
jgi:hypothetical protein